MRAPRSVVPVPSYWIVPISPRLKSLWKGSAKRVCFQAPAGSSQHPNFPNFLTAIKVPAIFLLKSICVLLEQAFHVWFITPDTGTEIRKRSQFEVQDRTSSRLKNEKFQRMQPCFQNRHKLGIPQLWYISTYGAMLFICHKTAYYASI